MCSWQTKLRHSQYCTSTLRINVPAPKLKYLFVCEVGLILLLLRCQIQDLLFWEEREKNIRLDEAIGSRLKIAGAWRRSHYNTEGLVTDTAFRPSACSVENSTGHTSSVQCQKHRITIPQKEKAKVLPQAYWLYTAHINFVSGHKAQVSFSSTAHWYHICTYTSKRQIWHQCCDISTPQCSSSPQWKLASFRLFTKSSWEAASHEPTYTTSPWLVP